MGGLASVLPFLAALKKSTPDMGAMNGPATLGTTPGIVGPPGGSDAPPDLSVPGMTPANMPPPSPPVDSSAVSDLAPGSNVKPQLSKGTKLMMLLQGGLQGGLNGMAQNAQTYAQTGRNAGFGGGFMGAQTLPFMQAYQRGQLAQQQAQTQLIQSQSQMVPTPYGPMAAGMAKLLFPALVRAGATEQAATTRAGATTQAAQTGASAKITAAQMQLGPVADVPQDLQDQFGLPAKLPLKMLNTAESAANRPLTTVQGAGGPAIVNKQTKQTTNLGLGAPALARPVQVADPSNPGNITYQSAGQAIQQGAMAPQSAPAITAKATARAVAPGGKVGEEVNAFNTAIQHADLLQQAAAALHNGDVQGLNKLKNQFTNYFGATGPITANTIAQAYTREISKMLTSGHMTDAEIGAVGSTLDPNRQSLPQMQAVLGAYKALASSKMQVRQQGVQQGMQGRPNFPSAGPPPGASHAVVVNGKVVGYTSDGKTMTPAQ